MFLAFSIDSAVACCVHRKATFGNLVIHNDNINAIVYSRASFH